MQHEQHKAVEHMLKTIFGHEELRPGQRELVEALLQGHDVLAVMPTGAGKSLCYQLPALLYTGITLVISPLISLMNHQVQLLLAKGVRAAYLNSSLTEGQCRKALENAKKGVYKIIYVAPERLLTPSFLSFARYANISMVCVDEAHCVSQWGRDFRPGYRRITDFLQILPCRPPVGAFTATATRQVQQDIEQLLGLLNPVCLTTGFDRPNLYFEVQHLERNERMLLLKMYLQKHNQESGIIYCTTRKSADNVYQALYSEKILCTRYHAGLSVEERKCAQEMFEADRVRVMVATNAFGMGIDKPNIRFVIHYGMPLDLEGYYQEAGRAGRDGQQADCILLYTAADVKVNNFLISGSEQNQQDEHIEQMEEKLYQMTAYCHTKACLRHHILRYFGEKSSFKCKNCSNCCSKSQRAAVSALLAEYEKQKQALLYAELDNDLMNSLKKKRADLAQRVRVPIFVIAADSVLVQMCQEKPNSYEQLAKINGMGVHRAERYGAEFLSVIQEHTDNGIQQQCHC